MAVTDFFAGEIVTELLKQLIAIGRKSTLCRSSADQLISDIHDLLPIIQEIRFSEDEVPQHRQTQLNNLSQTLKEAAHLCNKVLASNRWNVYKNLQFARKMDKLEKRVARFMHITFPAHILADVRRLKVATDVGLDSLGRRMGALTVGGVWVEEEVKRVEEEERERGSLGSLKVGKGLVVGKKKVKELLLMDKEHMEVVEICGIGGSGKTTLAREVSRDEQVTRHFSNGVIFLTVSQSPNVEHLKQTLWTKITGNQVVGSNYIVPEWNPQWNFQFNWRIRGRTLIILDDVWSLDVLEKLTFHIPGCKTLVVSRFQFSTVNSVYQLELLSDEEAMSLFCHSAFGQKAIPPRANKKLVEQVVKECKGLPLAVKVIGASLRDQPELFWVSAKNRLSRGEAVCDSHELKLLERMAISVEYLTKRVKECFLDLGSFPEDKKIPIDVLINMWVEIHDIDADEGFAILTELSKKNLITLVKDARAGDICNSYFEISVTQHDVLRDMALHLSNRDSLNERIRLLMPRTEERLPKEWERHMDLPFQARIVSIHTGKMEESDWFHMEFPKVEVLILNFSSSEYYLPPFIETMRNLRALILLNSGNSNAVLTNLSVFASMQKLRSFYLEKVTVPQLPNTNVQLPNLRKISLVLCDVNNSLSGSILDFPGILPCLSELTFDHCVNLVLPSTICMINSIKSLNITNCHDLHELPAEIGKLKFLQILRLYACLALKKLPQGLCELENLKFLDISQCVEIRSLPEKMGELIRLEKIDMRECEVSTLPASIKSLRNLEHVICDGEASWLWKNVENVLPELTIQVAEERFTLDWLSD